MEGLVELDADHPGFRDPVYRSRRNEIAATALAHVEGTAVPRVAYTPAEEQVWRIVCDRLRPAHAKLVHPELQALQIDLGLLERPLPQLEDMNAALATTGFRMEPVAGLVVPRTFLEALGRGVFLSTQYLRHASRPLYTPEPDLVHELVGHAASLRHPDIADLSRAFGHAAAAADDTGVDALVRVYWWTLEFGLVAHGGRVTALGAGLLSSAGELASIHDGPELRAWDVGDMAATRYDPTRPNPVLFVAPSLQRMVSDLVGWLASRAAA